jgi:hypothetical protein
MLDGFPSNGSQAKESGTILMAAQEPKQGKFGDSQHWYSMDGKPAHDQPNKSKPGEFRPTTLRDARSQNLLPSVSSILAVMAKPGLNGWMKEQVAEAALEVAWRTAATASEFVDVVLQEAESRMTKARDLGTEIHGAIERYLDEVRKLQTDPKYPFLKGYEYAHQECVQGAVAALKDLGVWGQPFEVEKTFASPLGYGGTVDFRIEGLIVDFKAVDSLEKRLTYIDRCAQLCAYCIPNMSPLSTLRQERLVNLFISTSEPGKYLIHEWSTEDKEHGWNLFQACYELWVISNKYDPRKLSQTAQSS